MATSETPTSSTRKYGIASVTYQSPNSAPFTWKQETETQPADKTAYLAELRKATAKMQEQINTELTTRMEEDKAREASDANGNSASKGKGVVDEAKEEDNYGEEVVEED